MAIFTRAALIVAFCIFLSAGAAAKRVAFIMGVDEYIHLNPLQKAVGDARAVKAMLQERGDTTIAAYLENPTRDEFWKKWDQFLSAVAEGDEAIVHISSHGIEIDGINYLLTKDAPSANRGRRMIEQEAIRFGELLANLSAKNPRFSLFILDACRNNPYAAKGTRGIGGTRGLARIDAPEGAFVMYSAGINEEALDRLSETEREPTSVYMRTLIPLLKTPGLKIQDVAQQVREDVFELAAKVPHRQSPTYYDNVIGRGRFCFAGCEVSKPKDGTQIAVAVHAAPPVTPPPAKPGAVAPQPSPQQTEQIDAERRAKDDDEAFAAAVKIAEPAALRFYLERFPSGRHREKALREIVSLEQAKREKAEADAWERAQRQNTLNEYQEFLKLWPSGQYASAARSTHNRLFGLFNKWKNLKESKKLIDIRQLLRDAKETEFAAVVEAQLDIIEREQKASWDKTERTRTKAAYDAFLASWGDGDFVDDARSRLEEIEAARLEWERIRGKNNEHALEAFLKRSYIGDFEGAALAELVATKRNRNQPLPEGVSVLKADVLAKLIDGKAIVFANSAQRITFKRGPYSTVSFKMKPSYLQTATKERFTIEGSFTAEIIKDESKLAIIGIGGVQESRADKTGSIFLLQILSNDNAEDDLNTKDRLYTTMQIIKDSRGYVCNGTSWTFVLGEKPALFEERCRFE